MNLAYYDLVSIRLTVLCFEFGSLTAAAREAQMSVSRASHRLTNLEHGVGLRLFIRNTQGLVPTPAGQLFVEEGRALLLGVQRLHDRLHLVSCDATDVCESPDDSHTSPHQRSV